MEEAVVVPEGFLEDSWNCLHDEEELAKGQEEKDSPGEGNPQRDAGHSEPQPW